MNGGDEAITDKLKSIRWRDLLIASPGFLLSLLLAVLILSEWVRIGLIADPEEIKSYHFGSEAMMADGGWYYRSAKLYAWFAFAEGLFLGCLSLSFITGYLRPSKKIIYISYVVLLLFLIFTTGRNLYGWAIYAWGTYK